MSRTSEEVKIRLMFFIERNINTTSEHKYSMFNKNEMMMIFNQSLQIIEAKDSPFRDTLGDAKVGFLEFCLVYSLMVAVSFRVGSYGEIHG